MQGSLVETALNIQTRDMADLQLHLLVTSGKFLSLKDTHSIMYACVICR